MRTIRTAFLVTVTLLLLVSPPRFDGNENAESTTSAKPGELGLAASKANHAPWLDVSGEREFIEHYLKLSAAEKVQTWHNSATAKRHKIDARLREQMTNVLIALEPDTVPYLIKLGRQSSPWEKIDIVRILCFMDRFVPHQELPLKEGAGSIYIYSLNLGGEIDWFRPMDGHRIGKEGLGFINWASEQTEDKELRFRARSFSGLLEQDLRALPLDGQFRRWKAAVDLSKGGVSSVNEDEAEVCAFLTRILAEALPDSLPLLTEELERGTDPYTRESAIEVLQIGDLCTIRLRATEMGRQAIKATEKALAGRNLKPAYGDRPDVRADYWKHLSAQFLQDDARRSHWPLYHTAFKSFYAENLPDFEREHPSGDLRHDDATIPSELDRFLGYLTGVDPSFPSWEYCYCGPANRISSPSLSGQDGSLPPTMDAL